MEKDVLKLTYASVIFLGLFAFESYRLKSIDKAFRKHPFVILVLITAFLFAWAYIRKFS